ncbi:hypothetical protein FIV42_05915 [Persicimonas caeni]|uniref:Protein kinase domain-containing protein n=1 Tax=Persicimonas caeni TaxID=2292766 RepID=A0A4Y6PPZ6_PERCE|nr:serine/threonine-protein kinase [Persicimonas caeni]QDG50283.1 hypothetical protein FIV42_05915 [Persicimonas caeni]QED31504.1 protein kinase [Persicimonas caeni]
MSPFTPPAVRASEKSGRREFFIGPYRLTERLGKGGMGLVYRAIHVDTGEQLAIKTPLDARQEAVAALRREVQILETLDHPGVVRLLDKGTSSGVPWFAMELLAGPTLLDHLGSFGANYDSQLDLEPPATNTHQRVNGRTPTAAAGVAERLKQRGRNRRMQLRRRFDLDAQRSTLVILTRVCRTLSYLHNKGVVHRDLKPSNIFLRSAQDPVLVDFGVVGWFEGTYSRDRLAGIDRQRFAGTLQYMAPEQLRGDYVDARADLYALGCILYASTTGRHPFAGLTPQAVIRHHLDGAYVPPEELVADVPAELLQLIERLLEPDPRDRVGHADIVARKLESVTRTEPPRTVGSESAVRSSHLSRPRFVGREHLLEEVLDALQSTKPANLVMIGGLRGSGKTRLVMEVATLAERAGYVVTAESAEAGVGESAEGAYAEPLSAFRATLQTIADRCREYGAVETAHLVGRRANVLAQYEPTLAGLPGNEALQAPTELPPRAARMRAYAYLTETLAAFAETEPLLIIIDDVHLVDEMSLEFLASTLRNGGLEGVAIAATYRVEHDDRLGDLLDAAGLRRFELEPLSADDIASLLQGMLAVDEVSARLVDRLVAVSAGSPFVVSEYLHAAVDEGLISRRDDGSWDIDDSLTEEMESSDVLPLSRRVSELIEGRLERLCDAERDLVDVAAVIARRFTPALLAEVTGRSTEELGPMLERLCDKRILTPIEGAYRLVEHVRRLAYELLAEDKRHLSHQKVARALEHGPSEQVEARQLVEQWRGAGIPSRELCYIERAAKDALVRGASVEALGLLRRGLRLATRLSDPAEQGPKLRRARLERLLAKVYWSRGNIDETVHLLERSLADLGFDVPDSTTTWSTQALGQTARQLTHLVWPPHEVDEELGDPQLLDEILESSLALLWAWLIAGEINKVVVLAVRLANINDRLGAGRGQALPYALIAALCRRLNLGPLAGVYEMRAWENFGDARSEMDVVGATQVFAYTSIARGEWDDAERLMNRARDVSERAGDLLNLENLLISEAVLEVCRGRLEHAQGLVREAEDPRTPVRQERMAAWSRVVRAMIARQQGECERAIELLRAPSGSLAKLVTGRGFALSVKASAEVHCGEHSHGFRTALEALDLFEELSGGADTNMMLYPIYQCLGEVLFACWCSEELTAHERERALGKARYLTHRLGHLATHVPAARPAWLRNEGMLAAVDGDFAHASALLSESLAGARKFDLPFEDRLTRLAVSTLGALPTL